MKKISGKIKSIKLKEICNTAYWEITLTDIDGNIIGKFGDGMLSTNEDFRNQTYGIMRILSNYNLFELDNQKKSYPVMINRNEYFVSCIANKKGAFMTFDRQTGKVRRGAGLDLSEYEERQITSLCSRSGCLTANTKSGNISQGVTFTNVYYGFDPLFDIFSDPCDRKLTQESAENFKNVICELLKICEENELIHSEELPKVKVILDDNQNIVAIGNKSDMFLTTTDSGYAFTTGEELLNEDQKIYRK